MIWNVIRLVPDLSLDGRLEFACHLTCFVFGFIEREVCVYVDVARRAGSGGVIDRDHETSHQLRMGGTLGISTPI